MDCEPVLFNPPLYIQRDEKITDIINFHKDVIHVLEVGCGECRLINRLKQSQQLQKIIGIDFCRNSLESNFLKLKPLSWDFIQRRDQPFFIELYLGDILKLTKDISNSLVHQILILTEVIEHLVIEDLDQLAHSLFHIFSSPILIISTPNFEFNICFEPNQNRKFRHYDHKFEWTRAEFQDWCNLKASTYGYSVRYDGVGDPPANKPTIGFCTQFAIFHKLNHPHSNDACRDCHSENPCYLSNKLITPTCIDDKDCKEAVEDCAKLTNDNENIKITENQIISSHPEILKDTQISTLTKKPFSQNEESFELIVRIKYPHKVRLTNDTILEELLTTLKSQVFHARTIVSLYQDGIECKDNIAENVVKEIGEDENDVINDDDYDEEEDNKFENHIINSDNNDLKCNKNVVNESIVIKDGFVFICIETIYQQKKIKEYFEQNLTKFREFLMSNNLLLDETRNYFKCTIEDTDSESESETFNDEPEVDYNNIQDFNSSLDTNNITTEESWDL